ncbi:MAG: NAD-dependent epimerase/dehydratase family protein, partial [Oligosphaeraceae bacterium]|nr:NAD-dependent epimerase/dehydratase family protein [Oligosphaeraceae bacterium]
MQSHHHERILLTGGAGLIGSAICWRLNQLGCQDIVIVDHLG